MKCKILSSILRQDGGMKTSKSLSFKMKLKRIIPTAKRRSYKLYNKLFIYLPVDILIYLNNLLCGVSNSKSKYSKSKYSKSSAPAETPEKRLLIFRHDGIGDYIMFRNFLEVLKKSDRFAGYKITLLGNAAWKDLAEFLDKDNIDEFIWLDKKKFTADFFYRYKEFKEITSVKYDILIHPFSREFFNADNDLACLIKADKKIGSIRIPRYTKPYKSKILGIIYNELIADEENIRFEFYKNKIFFEKLLSEKINLNKPFINLPLYIDNDKDKVEVKDTDEVKDKDKVIDIDIDDKDKDIKSRLGISSPYAAFFIGASVKHRKWPPAYFAETAAYLHTKYGFHIVLCGGKSELNDAAEFTKHFPADLLADKTSFTDAVGKISLIELLYVVKDASLVISNETMAPHIAMALANTNINSTNSIVSSATPIAVSKEVTARHGLIKPIVIVISTGEASYGHFVPYPEELGGSSNYAAVFHPHIEQNPEEYKDITEKFGRGYDDRFDISEITAASVLNKIDELFF